jgi:threonine/homoserine/homoserine lactone efflux protein
MPNFYPFLIYVLITTFTPGPNNIMSMVSGIRNGYRKSLRFLFGIISGFFVVMVICGILNISMASLIPASEKWLKIFGAAYMIYLAYHVVRSGPMNHTDEPQAEFSYWFGFSMQFLNVKGILYGITVYSLFITGVTKDPWIILLFAVILAAVGFVAISSWAIGGNLTKTLANKYSVILNYLMGGLLIYTAITSLLK